VAARWQATSREELERETRRLRQENERLRRELERAERERQQIERERDRLREERDRLEKEPEAARRAAKRPAAPFSKGAPSPHPRRPGRKPGREDRRHRLEAEVQRVPKSPRVGTDSRRRGRRRRGFP
jgi:DNA repair exonuclease SbcCD ATPase subunit